MKTIIVGIDGSHAAITAALWGVDEAISERCRCDWSQ